MFIFSLFLVDGGDVATGYPLRAPYIWSHEQDRVAVQ